MFYKEFFVDRTVIRYRYEEIKRKAKRGFSNVHFLKISILMTSFHNILTFLYLDELCRRNEIAFHSCWSVTFAQLSLVTIIAVISSYYVLLSERLERVHVPFFLFFFLGGRVINVWILLSRCLAFRVVFLPLK